MLDGHEGDISIEDWKTHTNYNGYEESDPQISWFWKENDLELHTFTCFSDTEISI